MSITVKENLETLKRAKRLTRTLAAHKEIRPDFEISFKRSEHDNIYSIVINGLSLPIDKEVFLLIEYLEVDAELMLEWMEIRSDASDGTLSLLGTTNAVINEMEQDLAKMYTKTLRLQILIPVLCALLGGTTFLMFWYLSH